MNERIRELAIEAGLIASAYNGFDPTGLTKAQKKFAELIVRECIDCARGAGLQDDVAVRNKLGFNDGISEAVTNMKKHFGVEE